MPSTTHSRCPPSDFSQIPEELRALPNWIAWRREKRAGKSGVVRETKVPYNAITGKLAKSNDPSTWTTFENAMAALKNGYDGVGFCLTPPHVGVDLDGCRRPDGTCELWAEQIIRKLDSYAEVSPSGEGVRIIVTGELPDGRRQKDFQDREHHGIGLYDAARGRYVTMTGRRINGAGIRERTAELRQIHADLFPPKPCKKAKASASGPLSDEELIARAKAAKDSGKFARLWNGQWEGDYPSQSEAEMALLMKLAFWTGRDASRMDLLFRRSGLMRDKWDRADYREATIGRAVEQTTETWRPKGKPRIATVNLDALGAPSITVLNALEVWQGRIHFRSLKRRGPMVIAITTSGAEIVWPSTAELHSFSKSQAIISDTTNILIPTPPLREIHAHWEQAVDQILRLAAADGQRLEPALKEEVCDLLRMMWRAAGQPCTATDDEKTSKQKFIGFMRNVLTSRRDPTPGAIPPPCVFIAEEACWVHLPSFRAWLSIPSLINRHYPLADSRNGLLLLGFRYLENVTRRNGDDSETCCLWRGPLETLGDDL
jgi:hypothetical protein